MNLKKYLRLKKELDVEPEFTAEDEERLNSLKRQMGFTSAEAAVAKKRVNYWKIFAPVASVAAALILTLTCVFTLSGSPDYKYNDENIIRVENNFVDIQNDLKLFNIDAIENSVENIFLSYDSISGDKLFYRLNAVIDFSKLSLIIVINENYNYNFGEMEETTDRALADYTVTYCIESNRGDVQTTYRGWIEVETETVYFEYVQIPAAGDEAFFETIQEIIKVK